jgi:hypothetical protein
MPAKACSLLAVGGTIKIITVVLPRKKSIKKRPCEKFIKAGLSIQLTQTEIDPQQ